MKFIEKTRSITTFRENYKYELEDGTHRVVTLTLERNFDTNDIISHRLVFFGGDALIGETNLPKLISEKTGDAQIIEYFKKC